MSAAKLNYMKSTNTLMRKIGPFWSRKVDLDMVYSIIATSDDSLTHEEIHIHFITREGQGLVISEFDENFNNIVSDLESIFSGLNQWRELNVGPAFEPRRKVLWERKESDRKGDELINR